MSAYFVKFGPDGEPLEVFKGYSALEARYGVPKRLLSELFVGYANVHDPDPFLLAVDGNEYLKCRNAINERKRRERQDAEMRASVMRPWDTEMGKRMTESLIQQRSEIKARRITYKETIEIGLDFDPESAIMEGAG